MINNTIDNEKIWGIEKQLDVLLGSKISANCKPGYLRNITVDNLLYFKVNTYL